MPAYPRSFGTIIAVTARPASTSPRSIDRSYFGNQPMIGTKRLRPRVSLSATTSWSHDAPRRHANLAGYSESVPGGRERRPTVQVIVILRLDGPTELVCPVPRKSLAPFAR